MCYINIIDLVTYLLSMEGQKALGFKKRNTLICVSKMIKGLIGLDDIRDSNQWRNIFLVNYSFKGIVPLNIKIS